jgi:hypothetical protein
MKIWDRRTDVWEMLDSLNKRKCLLFAAHYGDDSGHGGYRNGGYLFFPSNTYY